jgi:hypothetical protein
MMAGRARLREVVEVGVQRVGATGRGGGVVVLLG